MRRSWLKKIVALTMVLIMVMSMAACGKKETGSQAAAPAEPQKEEKVKLRIYADYADEDTKAPYDYAVAELAKEMPNVELELEPSARDDGQKLKTYAQTGNMPDIFQTGVDHINIFKKSNNILQLDPYAAEFKSKLLPAAESLLVHPDGHIYSFPFAGKEYVTLYYNKALFEKYNVKVPTTFDEMKEAIKVFKKYDIIPLSIFAKEKWPCVAFYDVLATRLDPGGILKLNDGKGKASEEAYKKAAEQMVELVNAGLFPKGATNLNYDQAAALFYEEKAAMFINGQWEIEASTNKLGDKVDWMFYPSYDAAAYESGKAAWSGGGSLGGFAVSANTKNPELAAKVAAFIAMKYAECKFTTRGNPFVATEVDKPIVKQLPPMMEKFVQHFPNITSTTGFAWHMGNAKFKAALEDNTQRLLTGTYKAEQFVKDMDKAIEEANK